MGNMPTRETIRNYVPSLAGWWTGGSYDEDVPPSAKKRKLSAGSSVIGGSSYENNLEIGHLRSEIKRMKETHVPQEEYKEMVRKYKAEKHAKEDALRRLSAIAASKLRHKNPNIADLSDTNRPTKIAEKFAELYDNLWTDAFEALEKSMNQIDIIFFLREILMKSYRECKVIATDNYFEKVQRCIECPIECAWSGPYSSKSILSETLQQQIKEFRKSRAKYVLKDVEKAVRKILTHSNTNERVQKYVSSCVEITWLMVVQEPPVALSDSSPSRFDTQLFKEYTKRGPYIDYVLWPVMMLHEGGPILSKGVAQGCNHPRRH